MPDIGKIYANFLLLIRAFVDELDLMDTFTIPYCKGNLHKPGLDILFKRGASDQKILRNK